MKFLKILGLLLAVFAVLLVSLWWAIGPVWLLTGPWWPFSRPKPSDAELQRQFKMHRADFDQLIEMMDEDRQMSRIAPDFTWRQDNVAWPRAESEWGISKARWDEYRGIFRRVGAKDGITRSEKSSDITIDIWSWGLAIGGTSVAYLHCGQPRNGYAHIEAPCIEGKDSGRMQGQHGDGYRYRKIEPDWFIYEESN
jgi:hypothetical protein